MTARIASPMRQTMRRLPLIAFLILAACGKQGGAPNATADAPHGATIPCALGGSSSFRDDCTVERITAPGGLTLVLHHADGGFRRLLVTTDGRGVVTADGAQEAAVSVVDPATIEVAVGEDRYRLPATIKGQPLPER